ncbi:hypothetical protein DdX_12772 [Ditylenchus destructor]|uniref:Uncharacterized protein n=1 Tax=Ditylenchus destructor TaxID=166010 RepID=A0AAD4MUX4_9BILA|nr:hypothetical protein DdX_12772 [Ditylenchus destructor]
MHFLRLLPGITSPATDRIDPDRPTEPRSVGQLLPAKAGGAIVSSFSDVLKTPIFCHFLVNDDEEDMCDVTFGEYRTQSSVKVYFAKRFKGLRSVNVGITDYMRIYFRRKSGETSQNRLLYEGIDRYFAIVPDLWTGQLYVLIGVNIFIAAWPLL